MAAAIDDTKVAQVREKFLKKYNGSILDDTYDERDVKWVKSCDPFIRAVLKSFKTGGNVDKAVDLINDVLLFRAKMKLNDFKESDIHQELRDLNGIIFHGKDKEGRKVLHFQVKKQKKGHLLEETKRSIAFHFNQHYVISPDEPIVTLFDMTDAGVGNMDLDISKFIIQCSATYFPNIAAKNLMFKMSPVLEAVWTIIKAFMDSEQTKNTIFVSKKNIQEHIDKDQLLPHMIKEAKKK
jgi:hypothetical protein